mgnify:CR=1 FL=1|jgi:hypothetical protein
MITRLILLAFTVLYAATLQAQEDTREFVPPDDGYDWVQLTSGEWLKGELTGFFEDTIEFDSDILDDLTIDREDVARFFSGRNFSARIHGNAIVTGRVQLNETDVVIFTQSGERIFSRDDLIALTLSAEREIDRWSGDISFGTNIRSGNNDFIEYNMIAGFERRTASSRGFIDYIGTFNETEGEQTANNHRVNFTYDRFSDSKFFWRPINGQYFRDPFQNIANQLTLETGLGYEILATGRTDWEIYAGVGITAVERVSVEVGQDKNTRSPSSTIGSDFETELTSWMDYLLSFQATFVDEASGEYQHHLLTTLSTDLIGDIDLDVSLVWDRTQNPPPNAAGETPEKDDYRLLVGIGFDF